MWNPYEYLYSDGGLMAVHSGHIGDSLYRRLEGFTPVSGGMKCYPCLGREAHFPYL
jgi:hypothetical protein